MMRAFLLCLLMVLLLGISGPAAAQSHMYMDESGNIHFAKSISEVPLRYKDQVVPPTPLPVEQRFSNMKQKPVKRPEQHRLSLEEKQALKDKKKKQRAAVKAQKKATLEAEKIRKRSLKVQQQQAEKNPLGLNETTSSHPENGSN